MNLLTCAVSIGLGLQGMCVQLTGPTVQVKGNTVMSNGIKVYYEVHGKGEPLVLLHGAFATAEGWTPLLPKLTQTRKVILIEMQGHGRTPDREGPLNFQSMAGDVVSVLKELKIENADVFGYSLGGSVALAMAIHYPNTVRRLALLAAAAGSCRESYEPASFAQLSSIKPENFNFPVLKEPYTRLAPDPSQWSVLVKKVVTNAIEFKGFDLEQLKAIQCRTLIIQGDRDEVKPEHAVAMRRAIPRSQLHIIPNEDHFVLFTHPDKVIASLVSFLEAN